MRFSSLKTTVEVRETPETDCECGEENEKGGDG